MNKILVAAVAASFSFVANAANAGEQYLDAGGYAVSGHDVVAYHSLPQSPVGTAQPAAIPGKEDFKAEHNGATWLFASAANRDAFVVDPDKYAPLYDGHCAYGVSLGGKVPANPDLWRIVDGKLYLNITKQIVEFWEGDIPSNITASETKWAELEPKPASTNPVPNF